MQPPKLNRQEHWDMLEVGQRPEYAEKVLNISIDKAIREARSFTQKVISEWLRDTRKLTSKVVHLSPFRNTDLTNE